MLFNLQIIGITPQRICGLYAADSKCALLAGWHLVISPRGHRLLGFIAQQITGPTCCHWLVTHTPAAAASPPAQLVTQELLAEQCARQQLQRVLRDAVTITVSSSM